MPSSRARVRRTRPTPAEDRSAAVSPTPSPPHPDVPGAGARLDGRRAHVLDRAAEYVRLADQGLSAAQIARRRRKSPGHVSILLRLGRALATVPEHERAALRSPRVTWRLVQRLVRVDVDAASLRKQLRDAVGGFSTHNVDGRQRRTRRARTDAPAGVAAGPGVAWGWDATWFADDPEGYAAAHLAHLTHVHHAVARRVEEAVKAQGTASPAALDAGQSLRGLQRRLRESASAAASGGGPTPTAAQRRALAVFAALGRALHAVPPAAGAPTPALVTPDDVAADLDEP